MDISAGIFGAVGGLVSGRCYPEEAPQSAAFPFVVYRQTDMQTYSTLLAQASTDVVERYAIDVWADSRQQAGTLAQSIIAAMRTANATMGNLFEGLGWDYDADTGLHACTLNYLIPNTV